MNNRRNLVHVVDVAVVALIGYVVVHSMTNRPPVQPQDPFLAAVDLEPLRKIAVQDVGRIKSFDSFANGIVRNIAGPNGIEGEEPAAAYLELLLRPDAFTGENIIYVKKVIRPQISRAMAKANVAQSQIEQFLKDGMISQEVLTTPQVWAELQRMDADVLRTAKFVHLITSAMQYADPRNLAAGLRVIPPPSGDEQQRWSAGQDVWGLELGGQQGRMTASGVPGLDSDLQQKLAGTWQTLATAWRQRDAQTASSAIASLADQLRQVQPSLYPDAGKLGLESWYFRWHAFVWNWIVYVMAAVPLLLSIIYRWRGAYRVGVVMLLIAFAIHTASLGIRWYLAGRIPNSNMYEAILAATWFGVLGAIVLEAFVHKTAMRGLFFLGSGVCAMVAMMCQHFMPTTLRPDIENVMPVLNDVWLYIHTNVIIWSYALIGMAAITALLYLRYRLGGGDPAVAKAGGAGALILDGAPGKGDSFLRENPATVGQVLDASTMVTMELSFIMLWAGLVMGAIWADHSWGRPWGWDPKEVFALCTFIIFLILVHVRFKVRDKGLWTAVLAVVGCGVMLFNWIVINFKISGLHSYA
ncbi:MAG TPA: cytochrome c biogenesis protein CcsA [Phycisphaerae bacterium]|nr:cytochrome c biogenesis protein CcsA [Phycisphaerae bacterium]